MRTYNSFDELYFSISNADRIPIYGSTALQSIGIDDNGRLEIEFNNDAVYQYDCFGSESVVMDDILDADSRGQYFYYHVRSDYPYYKIKSGVPGLTRYRPVGETVRDPGGKRLDWRASFESSGEGKSEEEKAGSRGERFQSILRKLGLKRGDGSPGVRAREGDWSSID